MCDANHVTPCNVDHRAHSPFANRTPPSFCTTCLGKVVCLVLALIHSLFVLYTAAAMDPYSAEGELVNIHNAFHQGQYQQVADFDTSSFSPSNALPARVLQLRARLALGQYDEVLADVKGESEPDLAAVQVLTEYLKGSSGALEKAQALGTKVPDNLTVQLLCGTVLAAAGHVDEALALLSKHQGSLDAVALIVQIHLQQNRADLAAKEAAQARKWAQDSLLVNIVESWVGMRQYQAAYYVFEELAQAVATQSVQSLVGQAVAELHLGRLPEAEAAFEQAQGLEPQSADVLANLVVLKTMLGKDTGALKESLAGVKPDHRLLVDFAEKRAEFERACERYAVKFEP
ncbi:coatomer epsilon subunit [Trichodelitschia bisporula]|uniref:Coatomer epsilon subunit n=1 Tax=Trichodelitschia bisporula TaxID=703511 RepID=A0A6G1HPK3_9PEZI|nr:coatomer epsilon subunit [Trichodelitschia bisporula]